MAGLWRPACLLTTSLSMVLSFQSLREYFLLCVASPPRPHHFVCGQQFCSRVYTQGSCCKQQQFLHCQSVDSTSAWRLKSGLQKLCVVTGASSGLGLDAAKVLADNDDYFVICAVRNPEKMKKVAEERGLKSNKYAILSLDLADQSSVKQFVFDLKAFKSNRPLDALVCNAAVYLPTDPNPQFSKDGFEMSMAAIILATSRSAIYY